MLKNSNSIPDYPYYNDVPTSISWRDWIIVLLALCFGFAVLVQVPHFAWLSMTADTVLRSILFGGIPMAAFAWRFGKYWTAIFQLWRWNYLWWGLLFGIINLAFTYAIGAFAVSHMHLVDNGVGDGISRGEIAGGPAVFYISTGIQLFGEEVFTILPFLFLMWLGAKVMGLSRGGAILLAWIGSALIFGAMHLSTYGWNVAQVLLLIAPVRLVLTLSYMQTKSIWTSTIAHILNDWTMFTFLMVVRAMTLSA
ncbi:peptidase [Novosphingobium barchaimii LL02]|uniref:Peptidase n=1 Tax=Novosphingobium barchaimii LL02 TaxID=1114963 RepID=A0A0J7XXQ3_9SPHN|nr:CPBP family intramembrane glutamic endopeptidase [Novosphingobium barchaimii]KMS56461.1 peptidase [Novosphingobium barchaimii LL02]